MTDCLSPDCLRQAFAEGGFAPSDMRRALEHFLRPCRTCWGQVATLASDDSVTIDLDVLTVRARENVEDPPLVLLLGRLVVLVRNPESVVDLAPTHRFLLRKAAGSLGAVQIFDLWRLLIEETRSAALSSSDLRVERWRFLMKILARYDQEDLSLVVRAYGADDLRIFGQRSKAEALLGGVLAETERGACRTELLAIIYETQADFERSLRRTSEARHFLAKVEDCLGDMEHIPGRLAEVRFRIAMTHLLEGDLALALSGCDDSLDLIPPGTDPRLRLEILHHAAAASIRREEISRAAAYLEAAEPFSKTHSSPQDKAQRDWLWGVVHLESGAYVKAEAELLLALKAFIELRATLTVLQILGDFVRLYLATKNASRLAWVFKKLVAMAHRPEVRYLLLEKIAQMKEEARKQGIDVPDDFEGEEN